MTSTPRAFSAFLKGEPHRGAPLRGTDAGRFGRTAPQDRDRFGITEELPCADTALLVPLKRSGEYRALRPRVAGLSPLDHWQEEGLHFFVFALRHAAAAAEGGAAVVAKDVEPPVAVFAMHPRRAFAGLGGRGDARPERRGSPRAGPAKARPRLHRTLYAPGEPAPRHDPDPEGRSPFRRR
jgi:hypothetical protein